MERSNNLIERTKIEFDKSLLYEDVTMQYLPYLQKNIPNSKVSFIFDGRGDITRRKTIQSIRNVTGFIETPDVSSTELDFESRYAGEYVETGGDAYSFLGFRFFTIPGKKPFEIPKEIALCDQIKDITHKFFKEQSQSQDTDAEIKE